VILDWGSKWLVWVCSHCWFAIGCGGCHFPDAEIAVVLEGLRKVRVQGQTRGHLRGPKCSCRWMVEGRLQQETVFNIKVVTVGEEKLLAVGIDPAPKSTTQCKRLSRLSTNQVGDGHSTHPSNVRVQYTVTRASSISIRFMCSAYQWNSSAIVTVESVESHLWQSDTITKHRP
jgi:hypothetical protein